MQQPVPCTCAATLDPWQDMASSCPGSRRPPGNWTLRHEGVLAASAHHRTRSRARKGGCGPARTRVHAQVRLGSPPAHTRGTCPGVQNRGRLQDPCTRRPLPTFILHAVLKEAISPFHR